MCILIVKPPNVEFPSNWEEICVNCHNVNDDGVGYATKSGAFKSVATTPREFARLTKAQIKPEEYAIIHFRWSTGGKTNTENCHPFKLSDGTYFAHNGVIEEFFPSTDTKSDTSVLSESVANFDELYEVCNQIAGFGNKFAMFHPDHDDVTVVGWEHGHWHQDMWFSNRSYESAEFNVTGFLPWLGKDDDDDDNDDDCDLVALEQEVTDFLQTYQSYEINNLIFDLSNIIDAYGYEETLEMINFINQQPWSMK